MGVYKRFGEAIVSVQKNYTLLIGCLRLVMLSMFFNKKEKICVYINVYLLYYMLCIYYYISCRH